MGQRVKKAVVREAPLLAVDEPVGDAVRAVIDSGLPALPVVEADGRLHGIFGEREFISALFPGYLGELSSAAFVPDSIDEVIDKRIECRQLPISDFANREHVDAGPDVSDTQLAETFLHHRVLIIPIVADRQVVGVVPRGEFFRELVERFMARDTP